MTLGRHPHLAALLGVTTHPDGATCMLVEYAPRGSLDTLLSHLAEKNAPPSEAVNPKPCTRNLRLKPETRNPNSETRNPKPSPLMQVRITIALQICDAMAQLVEHGASG